MDCKKVEKLLVEYLYRELSAKKTVEVERHLEVCDGCLKTLESWQAIHAGFQKSSEPKASPYLKQRLLAAAGEELSRATSFREKILAFLKPVVVAPVLVFGFLVLLLALFEKGPQLAQSKKVVQPAQPVAVQERDEIGQSSPAGPQATGEFKSLGYVSRNESERQKLQDYRSVEKEKPDEDKSVSEDSGRLARRELSEKDAETKRPSEYRLDVPAAAEPVAEQAAAPQEIAKLEAPKAKSMEEAKLGTRASNIVVSGLAGYSFDRAQARFQQDDLKGGWSDANQAIGQDQSKLLAPEFHQAGIQYQNNREYGKAILQYNLVLDNYPNYTYLEEVLQRLAESYEEIGQLEEARKAYLRLLKIWPQNKAASEKLQELEKKREAQDQLRSVGLEQKEK